MTNVRMLYRNLIWAGLLLSGIFILFFLSRTEKNPALSLKINEICTCSAGTFEGSSAVFADYIELYNPTDQAVPLNIFSISDGSGNNADTLLPAGFIEPGEYYLIYAAGSDGSVPEDCPCLPFAISAGETITLSYCSAGMDPGSSFIPIDSVYIPALETDTVYARIKDGSGDFTLAHPSPGATNQATGYLAEVPVFSAKSGFYESDLLLELSASDDLSIYYTLDGSIPTKDSTLYTEAIVLSDPSSQSNLHSAREDIAAISSFYQIPDMPVDKAVIVRAAAYDSEGNYSPTATAVYFLDYELKEGYDNAPVISLVTDPDNLFEHEKGIYIRGKLYQDGLDQALILPEFPWIELMDYTNYYIEGESSERPVSVSFFNSDHELVFQQDCGLRIRGNESRSFPQKSFTLFARKRYGSETIPSVFSESSLSYPDLILNNSKRLKKIFYFSLVEDRNIGTQKYTPCQLFLNGEYWGMYYLMEKYSAEYLEGTYGIDAQNALLVKATYEVQDGGDENLYLFKNLRNFLEQDMSDPVLYSQLLNMMDMQSFIDWMCTNIYICNTDTKPLGGNVFTWRVLQPGFGPYEDGKWRWMLYDVDDSLGVGIDTSQRPAYAIDSFVEHASYAPSGFLDDDPMPFLMSNEDFRKQFVLTFMDMANENFRTDRVNALLNQIEENYTPWAEKSYERWNTNPQDATFAEQIAEIRTFFENRFDYIVRYLAQHFSLTGSLVDVHLSAAAPEQRSHSSNNSSAGIITLNTITPDFTNGGWTGKYYTDYPITLTANAAEGEAFIGWEIEGAAIVSGTVADTTIQVQLEDSDVRIQAMFTTIK